MPLLELVYNNSYHSLSQKAPFEALYGKRHKLLIGWFEMKEAKILGLDLAQEAIEKVKIIQENFIIV